MRLLGEQGLISQIQSLQLSRLDSVSGEGHLEGRLLALCVNRGEVRLGDTINVISVITTGTINIELNDSITGGTAVKDGDKVTGYTISGVMPGQPVEKIVSVTNTGTSPAWLRVKLDISVTVREDGETIEMDRWISVKGQDQPVLQFDVNPDWFPAKDENGVTYYY